MIDNRAFNVMPMVTHRFPFDKTGDAFDLAADLRDGVVKAMIHFD
jgi:threonine dehydrogenase-like Zn-dependent dehydrogenase